jgi:hypothetical protein
MARKAQGQQGSGDTQGAAQGAGRPARRKATNSRRTTDRSVPREGRLELRRDIAEYRAAAEARADVVREQINAAIDDSRRIREEIEQRIADQLHTPRVVRPAAPARKRSRASTRASSK